MRGKYNINTSEKKENPTAPFSPSHAVTNMQSSALVSDVSDSHIAKSEIER